MAFFVKRAYKLSAIGYKLVQWSYQTDPTCITNQNIMNCHVN